MHAGRYLVSFFLVFALLLLGVVALNIRNDSTGQLMALGLRPSQAVDPRTAAMGWYPVRDGSLEGKLYNYIWYKPDAAVIGSSNAWGYFDVMRPSLRQKDGRAPFNFGIAGVTMSEMEAVFRHMLAAHKPKLVILDLEFYMFHAERSSAHKRAVDTYLLADRPNFRLQLLKHLSTKILALEPTLQNLRREGEALRKALLGSASAAEAAANRPWASLTFEERQARGRKALHEIERLQTPTLYWPHIPFTFVAKDGHSTLEAFRRILELAKAEGVEIRIFLSPHHVRQYEIIRAMGLWDTYLEWLRKITAIVAEVNAGRPCAMQTPLLDFGAYKPFSIDLEFVSDSHGGLFRGFGDSFHYLGDTATAAIDAVMAADPCHPAEEGIATPLTPQTIEAHIAAMAAGRAKFVAEHPDEVADVAAIMRETLKR